MSIKKPLLNVLLNERHAMALTCHSRMRLYRVFSVIVAVAQLACSANQNPGGSSQATGGRSASVGGGATAEAGRGGATDLIVSPVAGSGGGGPTSYCDSAPTADSDHDGYTVAEGDCNDCDAATNPGAFDIPGNAIDEDCSGLPDDEPGSCEDQLPLNGDASAAAKALGICRVAVAGALGKNKTWGLISARYVFPDGSTTSLDSQCATKSGSPNELSHGILNSFGLNVKPRQGSTLAALSSGIAQAGVHEAPSHTFSPSRASMCTRSPYPDGFPVSSTSVCGDIQNFDGENGGEGGDDSGSNGDGTVHDGIALELVIRAPTNAKGFTFDFDFYTFEYSQYVCSEFNDAFVALLFSRGPNTAANHNIAFDSKGNPVSVNNGFVEVCDPYTYVGSKGAIPVARSYSCQYGTKELVGTGFAESDGPNHAATGWLQTRADIIPGEEMTIRFAIWDAGDDMLDSTVLLDHFTWDSQAGQTVTVRPDPVIR